MSNPMTLKTVIITGGNSGLGFECAKAIANAHQGWHIVLACEAMKKEYKPLIPSPQKQITKM